MSGTRRCAGSGGEAEERQQGHRDLSQSLFAPHKGLSFCFSRVITLSLCPFCIFAYYLSVCFSRSLSLSPPLSAVSVHKKKKNYFSVCSSQNLQACASTLRILYLSRTLHPLAPSTSSPFSERMRQQLAQDLTQPHLERVGKEVKQLLLRLSPNRASYLRLKVRSCICMYLYRCTCTFVCTCRCTCVCTSADGGAGRDDPVERGAHSSRRASAPVRPVPRLPLRGPAERRRPRT